MRRAREAQMVCSKLDVLLPIVAVSDDRHKANSQQTNDAQWAIFCNDCENRTTIFKETLQKTSKNTSLFLSCRLDTTLILDINSNIADRY